MTPLLLLTLVAAQPDLAPLRGESPQTRKRLVELEQLIRSGKATADTPNDLQKLLDDAGDDRGQREHAHHEHQPAAGGGERGQHRTIVPAAAVGRPPQAAMVRRVAHSLLALDLADQACLIETGRLVLAGPAAALRANETIRRSYLGY